MRPGRLDRILYVSPPNPQARADIFRLNFKKMAVHDEVDPIELADMVSLHLPALRLSSADRPSFADRGLFGSRDRLHLSRRCSERYERRHERC